MMNRPVTYMDIKPSKTKNWTSQDYHMRKFVRGLESRAMVVDGRAILIIYDEKYPSSSLIIMEKI